MCWTHFLAHPRTKGAALPCRGYSCSLQATCHDRCGTKLACALAVQVTVQAGSPTADAGYQNGAGELARFNEPFAITWARDKTTNTPVLYVADSANHAIRRIDLSTGVVSTLWGGPSIVSDITSRGLDLFDRVRTGSCYLIPMQRDLVTWS